MQSGGELDDKRKPLRKEKQLVLSLETLVDDTLGRWKAQALPRSLGCLGFAEERVGGWGGGQKLREWDKGSAGWNRKHQMIRCGDRLCGQD